MTDQCSPGSADIRWAVNVLLEKIAEKFEANETLDIWKSDAAALVRGFKHDAASAPAQTAPSREEFEIVRKASRLFEDAANQWMDRALKAEAKLAALSSENRQP